MSTLQDIVTGGLYADIMTEIYCVHTNHNNNNNNYYYYYYYYTAAKAVITLRQLYGVYMS